MTNPAITTESLTPRLTTSRLVLRPLRLTDAPALQRICNDMEVARWTRSLPHPYELADAEQFVGIVHQQAVDRTTCILGVTRPGDDAVLGTTALLLDPSRTVAELGYLLERSEWRKGYGFEVAQRMVRYGFDDLGLNRIHASCVSINGASDRILRKLGMQPEGLFRQHSVRFGQTYDIQHFGLLRREFLAPGTD